MDYLVFPLFILALLSIGYVSGRLVEGLGHDNEGRFIGIGLVVVVLYCGFALYYHRWF